MGEGAPLAHTRDEEGKGQHPCWCPRKWSLLAHRQRKSRSGVRIGTIGVAYVYSKDQGGL